MLGVAEIAGAIRSFRFTYGTEAELEEGIAHALRQSFPAVAVHQQVVLGDVLGRIDLMVDRIGIEVKIAGQPREVARQVQRYLKSAAIDGVVLVTGSARHRLWLWEEDKVEVVMLGLSSL